MTITQRRKQPQPPQALYASAGEPQGNRNGTYWRTYLPHQATNPAQHQSPTRFVQSTCISRMDPEVHIDATDAQHTCEPRAVANGASHKHASAAWLFHPVGIQDASDRSGRRTMWYLDLVPL